VAPEPADLDFCYLTTTGHRSGDPHRIEIWFALHDGVVYMLSGGRDGSHWVQNLLRDPQVVLELGEETRATLARPVTEPDEDALARRLLVEKYRSRDPDDLGEWGRTAMPIAVEWRLPAS
jgi:deazaflavin-dependent oxidoreductase (nitroreductase family)